MGVDEYERTAQKIVRIRSMDNHRDQIISWLWEYPTLTAAQVCDWLKEHYGENYAERTVSRYVKDKMVPLSRPRKEKNA
ncbi:helix-turn-helix domain-containing protein [Clostridiaceae bacterium]|nr:helix-turn-helix domain-containing protein [Clostridiaceae bacterium]